MSAGYAYRCDQCGLTEISTADLMLRQGPLPEAWIYMEWIKDDCVRRGHFCSKQCLLGWAWEETK